MLLRLPHPNMMQGGDDLYAVTPVEGEHEAVLATQTHAGKPLDVARIEMVGQFLRCLEVVNRVDSVDVKEDVLVVHYRRPLWPRERVFT